MRGYLDERVGPEHTRGPTHPLTVNGECRQPLFSVSTVATVRDDGAPLVPRAAEIQDVEVAAEDTDLRAVHLLVAAGKCSTAEQGGRTRGKSCRRHSHTRTLDQHAIHMYLPS